MKRIKEESVLIIWSALFGIDFPDYRDSDALNEVNIYSVKSFHMLKASNGELDGRNEVLRNVKRWKFSKS